MKKQLYTYGKLLLVAFALNACGGGGSTSPTEDNSTQPPTENNTTTPPVEDNGTQPPTENNNTTTPPVANSTAEGIGIAVCTGADDGYATATVLEDGKKLKGIADTPRILLWHLSDGSKRACVTQGTVEVL